MNKSIEAFKQAPHDMLESYYTYFITYQNGYSVQKWTKKMNMRERSNKVELFSNLVCALYEYNNFDIDNVNFREHEVDLKVRRVKICLNDGKANSFCDLYADHYRIIKSVALPFWGEIEKFLANFYTDLLCEMPIQKLVGKYKVRQAKPTDTYDLNADMVFVNALLLFNHTYRILRDNRYKVADVRRFFLEVATCQYPNVFDQPKALTLFEKILKEGLSTIDKKKAARCRSVLHNH